MSELTPIAGYFLKFFTGIKLLFTKPAASVVLLAPVVPAVMVADPWSAIRILYVVFACDFITGLYAAYIVTRNSKPRIKSKTFRESILKRLTILRETISSEKLRKSFVKAIVYFGTIYLMYNVEKTFAIKHFNIHSISEQGFTLTTIAICIAIFIESYSIFFENLPKAGFDIGKAFTKGVKGIKKIKKDTEEDTEE